MALQFILYVTGKPRLHGVRKREFMWSNEHGCYVFESRTIDEKEFNLIVPQVLRKYEDMRPAVKIVTPESELQTAPLISDIPDIPPTAPREITLDEAVAVIQKLAPDRLRNRPGRPKAA